MKNNRLILLTAAVISFSLTDSLTYKALGADAYDMDSPPPLPAQEQPEILTKGPVHEAFASPVNLEDPEGIFVRVQPPENIEEAPPPDRPAGEQLTWVPGYWSWSTDRNGFIWISGCWRAAPPKMTWVAGYWARMDNGWKWVSGFWIQTGVKEIEYVKEPPAILDIEPSGLAPANDLVWVPGCWYWSQGQYVWRPGYWLQEQAGWLWIPSHYVRTPRGYVFSGGHWDYPLEHRGILFAPVCFPKSFHARTNFSYSLNIVLDLGCLKLNLFTSPRYSHYYFGDYYDDIYLRVGIFPRFDGGRRHAWYDPIFEHDKWRGKLQDPRWEEHGRKDYELRRDNRDLRPASTYREQEKRTVNLQEPQKKNIQIAKPMSPVIIEKTSTKKIERLDANVQKKISTQGKDLQQNREDRNRWESKIPVSDAEKEPVQHVKSVKVSNESRSSNPLSQEQMKVVRQPPSDALPANTANYRGDRNDGRKKESPELIYREQETRTSKTQAPDWKNVQDAQRQIPVAVEKTATQKYDRINIDAQKRISTQGNDLQQNREEKNRMESKPVVSRTYQEPVAPSSNSGRNSIPPSPEQVKIPASPMVGWQAPVNSSAEILPASPADERGNRNEGKGMPRGDSKTRIR
ncbi:MAG TPA: hypothetical protein DCZ94_09775 [Lentisphaeria bacterium]|nr:MAG: hypothetical protein A2X48_19015 [Lentisphaerae bacterium GWF2_49_21]HBC87231.1 hypothetical protein [Lentisphaeria bacterium]